jgi:flagellar biosynthesis protein
LSKSTKQAAPPGGDGDGQGSAPADPGEGKAPASETERALLDQVAVALTKEAESDALPRIVASGSGVIAHQILEIAFANGVKVREDADLVEILSAIDVDSDIPLEAFAMVAEILSYIYRANTTYGAHDHDQEEDR